MKWADALRNSARLIVHHGGDSQQSLGDGGWVGGWGQGKDLDRNSSGVCVSMFVLKQVSPLVLRSDVEQNMETAVGATSGGFTSQAPIRLPHIDRKEANATQDIPSIPLPLHTPLPPSLIPLGQVGLGNISSCRSKIH